MPAFSPFSIVFSTLSRTNFNFTDTFILFSANAFNFEQSKNLSFGKELILNSIICFVYLPFCWPFPKQALVFTGLQYKSFENSVGKGEIAYNEQFPLFPQRFLIFQRPFHYFHQLQNCLLQTLWVWKSLKFVIRERIKHITTCRNVFPSYCRALL